MKRIKGMLTVCCVCIVCLLLLTACSAKLSAPTSFRLDTDTLTLHWNKVRDAAAYTVEIGEDIKVTTRGTSYSLETLEPGEYVIRVQAITYSDDVQNSDFTEYRFTREKESGLRYKLTPTRDSYELVGVGSASGDVVMDDYYRGKPVVSIAKAALRRSAKITSFVVGNNVQTIGDNAFYACSQLTSVTIPNGVTSIGNGAFQSCAALESVILPDTLTVINPYTFSMCKSLKNLQLGTGVVKIDEYAFSDCSVLETLQIPDSVEILGTYAFAGCAALNQIQFGDNVAKLEPYVFYNCSSLTSVALNEGITEIGEYAFNSSGLVSVTVPDSVTVIGMYAFAECSALAEVNLGSGLTSIGMFAFEKTALIEDCQEDYVAAGNWILKVKNKEIDKFVMPENVIGIADAAFEGCEKLERINMENIRYVGGYAFFNCGSLWNVVLGDTNEIIGAYCFANCPYLTDVTLGNSLLRIEDYAFYNCERLEDSGINLPATLTHIGIRAFNRTRLAYSAKDIIYVDDWVVGVKEGIGLSGAFLKDGTRGIANYAFYNVVFMDGMLYIPDSVVYIGYCAFYKNAYLTQINLPASLKYIGEYAFTECANAWFGELGETVIPEGCEYIGDAAFRGCISMIGLSIPGTVEYIGVGAFKDCYNMGVSSDFYYNIDGELKPMEGQIVLNEGIKQLSDNAFAGCSGLKDIVLPDSLTQIGLRTFYKCEGLQSITIGSGLKEIPAYAFYDCSALQEILIPGNVRFVGSYAFRGCTGLKKIVIEEGVECLDHYAFFGCAGVEHLVIGSGCDIGNFTFRGMNAITAIYLGDGLESVGKLAFYGANNATIYLESQQAPMNWAGRWNASYLPVVYGVTLSEDNSYVVCWTAAEGALENVSDLRPLTVPSRIGYTFVGWSTTQNATVGEYLTLTDVPAGVTVYSVWTEAVQEEVPEMPVNPDASADVTG